MSPKSECVSWVCDANALLMYCLSFAKVGTRLENDDGSCGPTRIIRRWGLDATLNISNAACSGTCCHSSKMAHATTPLKFFARPESPQSRDSLLLPITECVVKSPFPTSNAVANRWEKWGWLVLECNHVCSKTVIPTILRVPESPLPTTQCLVLIVLCCRNRKLGAAVDDKCCYVAVALINTKMFSENVWSWSLSLTVPTLNSFFVEILLKGNVHLSKKYF